MKDDGSVVVWGEPLTGGVIPSGNNHKFGVTHIFSNQGSLTYQAGAGVVMDSIPSSEADEVEGKLEALAQAMDLAETL